MSSWKDPFVRAGVDFPAFKAEREGLHPEIFIRYRKPAPKEIEAQYAAFKRIASDTDKVIESMQAFIEKYLVSWAWEAEVNRENIRMLNHPILNAIYLLILQAQASDKIPDEYLQEGETGTPEGEQKKS